jgi:sirohydrochlorin ferrochelatase
VTCPPLVAVAHGSRDPAAQRTVEELLDVVRARRPDIDVRAAYVQNAEPALPQVLAGLATVSAPAAGKDLAVVVPLLLSRGYHVAVDIARAAAAHGAAVAPPLGPDPRLTEALAGRLAEAGVPARAPVVLAAAGSSDPSAIADVEAQAAALAERRGSPVVAAYASAVPPSVAQGVRLLGVEGTGGPASVAVATYLLAPGRFADSVRACALEAGAAWVSAPLGAHPALADLVVRRHLAAVTEAVAGGTVASGTVGDGTVGNGTVSGAARHLMAGDR